MSNNTLEYIKRETGANPFYTVIWLHGLGADGHDFAPLASQLKLPSTCRFIFPHAPMRPITCNQGYVMRGWYDILHFDKIQKDIDLEGVMQSCTAIRDLIAQEKARGIANKNIILAGFSQGGAIAYMTGLTYPEPLGGIIALSTYIPDIDTLHTQYHKANHATPVFIGHGKSDPIVDFVLGEKAYQTINVYGNPCTFRSYPMPHSVCGEEIEDISAWLSEIIRTSV